VPFDRHDLSIVCKVTRGFLKVVDNTTAKGTGRLIDALQGCKIELGAVPKRSGPSTTVPTMLAP
jgi:hypothetical protein